VDTPTPSCLAILSLPVPLASILRMVFSVRASLLGFESSCASGGAKAVCRYSCRPRIEPKERGRRFHCGGVVAAVIEAPIHVERIERMLVSKGIALVMAKTLPLSSKTMPASWDVPGEAKRLPWRI
jgi:hypothetical protein